MADAPTRNVIGMLQHAFARAAIEVHAETSPLTQAHRVAAERAHIDRMEDELAPLLVDIRDTLAEYPAMPGVISRLLDSAASPEHAAQFGLLQGVVLALMIGAMAQLSAPLLQGAVNQIWDKNPVIPLSPAEAAAAVVKGYMPEGDGADIARKSGLGPTAFGTYVDITGNPPGWGDLAAMLRRQIIDENRFTHGVRQGLTKNEWVPDLLRYIYGPPSPATAVAAAVQGHLTGDEARAIVAQGGIEPSNYDWLYETAGRPPGTQQMLGLMNRGLVTEQQVTDAIRESDIKNKYIPAILNLARHLMPQRTIVSGVHQGAISPELATQKLHEVGYSEEDAAILVSEGQHAAVSAGKHVAAGVIETAYMDRMIDRGDAAARLAELGYSAEQVDFMLSVKDLQYDVKLETQAVGVVRSQYLKRHLDDNAAAVELDTIGVPPAQRAQLLSFWSIERDVVTRDLTLAQLVSLWGARIIDETTFSARVMGLGYSPGDTAWLATLHDPNTTS